MKIRPLLRTTRLVLATALCLGVTQSAAQEAPLGRERTDFLNAELALQREDQAQFEALTHSLRNYALYPYLLEAQLRRNLRTVEAAPINDFLGRYADTPLARPLRAAWLAELARRQDWKQLLADSRPGLGVGAACLTARAQLAAGDVTTAYAMARDLWLVGQSQADACSPLFDAWRASGGLGPTLVWQRFQLAMDAGSLGLARHLQTELAPADRARADAWIDLTTNPVRPDAATLAATLGDDGPGALASALARHARRDAAATARAWDAHLASGRFMDADQIKVNQAVAVMLAVDRDPAAQRYFARIPPAARDAQVRTWQVRLALRDQNWPAARAALDELSADEVISSRWQYWRARSLEALALPGAEAAYARAATERDMYGFLAAAHLGRDPALKHAPMTQDRALQATLTAMPGFARAQQLHALGRIGPAQAELAMALSGRDRATIAQSAALLHTWGWHAQAIAYAAQAGVWDDLDLRFPAPFEDAVTAGARARKLPEALVRAVIRRESAYEPQARSSADARGLMQLLPSTAQRMARALGEDWDPAKLYEPTTNVRWGSTYFARVLGDFAGHVALAAASYNAGPNRVRRWLPQSQPMPADVWIETIPFGETREYVAAVTAYAVIYQARIGGTPITITQLLPPIPTADTVAAASAASCAGRSGDPDC